MYCVINRAPTTLVYYVYILIPNWRIYTNNWGNSSSIIFNDHNIILTKRICSAHVFSGRYRTFPARRFSPSNINRAETAHNVIYNMKYYHLLSRDVQKPLVARRCRMRAKCTRVVGECSYNVCVMYTRKYTVTCLRLVIRKQ